MAVKVPSAVAPLYDARRPRCRRTWSTAGLMTPNGMPAGAVSRTARFYSGCGAGAAAGRRAGLLHRRDWRGSGAVGSGGAGCAAA